MKNGSRMRQILAIVAICIVVLFVGVGLYSSYQGGLLPIKPPPQSFNETVFPSFDPTADSQTIKLGVNAELVSIDQIKEMAKDAIGTVKKGEHLNPSMLFPFADIGNNEIEEIISKGHGTDPITGAPDQDLTSGRKYIIHKKDPNVNPKIVVTVPNAEVYRVVSGDPTSKKTYWFIYKLKGEDGIDHEIEIRTEKMSGMYSLDILKDTPVVGTKNGLYFPFSHSKGIDGTPLEIATRIGEITEDNTVISVTFETQAKDIALDATNSPTVASIYDFLFPPNSPEKVAIADSK